MPPAKREFSMPVEQFPLEVGQLCNVVANGNLMPNYELLHKTDSYLTFRGDLRVSPQCEIVIVPWHAIERIGLVGVR